VSAKARLWTEESLRWLRGEFDDDALRGEVLLPETVFPPMSSRTPACSASSASIRAAATASSSPT
jgi:hypothetical protein